MHVHNPTLKKRSDFLRVATHQRKVVMTTMIVQLAERSLMDKSGKALPPLRVGYTASKKVGKAVQRNFARRRLRAVVDSICKAFVFSGHDLVVIARPATISAPFNALLHDFHQALTRLGMPSK